MVLPCYGICKRANDSTVSMQVISSTRYASRQIGTGYVRQRRIASRFGTSSPSQLSMSSDLSSRRRERTPYHHTARACHGPLMDRLCTRDIQIILYECGLSAERDKKKKNLRGKKKNFLFLSHDDRSIHQYILIYIFLSTCLSIYLSICTFNSPMFLCTQLQKGADHSG